MSYMEYYVTKLSKGRQKAYTVVQLNETVKRSSSYYHFNSFKLRIRSATNLSKKFLFFSAGNYIASK